MSNLTTVPSFVFYQGKPGDDIWENPIEVIFYNGSISLEQQGNYDQKEVISIHPDFIIKLLTEIKKNLPEAKKYLESK